MEETLNVGAEEVVAPVEVVAAPVEEVAAPVEEVVEEVFAVKLSERATRLIDGANEDSMEKKKSEGYF